MNCKINDTRGKLTLELTTTAMCDLACTYCFEGEKVNKEKLKDIDTLIKRIHEMLEFDWFNENYDGMSISFWGGEPTLNLPYIIQIMNEFKDNDMIVFHMYSNGYNLVNMKKLIEAVDYSKFEIQISYDGAVINDKFRVTHNNKTSSDSVLETFKYLADKGVTVFFKSTLPSDSLQYLHETWLDFEKLHNEYIDYNNVRVSFAPTIDYTMIPDAEAKEMKVKIFEEQILKIASEEIKFYEVNGRFLMSWFSGSDNKSNCSAGLNMIAIDTNGDSYACHGALYSDKKGQMKSSNIKDDDFINNIKDFNNSFEDSVKDISDTCKDCVATMCMVCPVSTFSLSEEKGFFGKWNDREVNGLCSFYKVFGEIDRTIQKYIRNK